VLKSKVWLQEKYIRRIAHGEYSRINNVNEHQLECIYGYRKPQIGGDAARERSSRRGEGKKKAVGPKKKGIVGQERSSAGGRARWEGPRN
jgi:hypothetical protein